MDQKNRNAYKRWWRNRRNYYKAHVDVVEATRRLDRSRRLMYRAEEEILAGQDMTK